MVERGLTDRIAKARKERDALARHAPATWRELVLPIEVLRHRVDTAWAPIRHLNNVRGGPAMTEAYQAGLGLITSWNVELFQDRSLFEKYSAVLQNEGGSLGRAERRLLEVALREFRLNGVALALGQRRQAKSLKERLEVLQAKFEENVRSASGAWSRRLLEHELEGLPGLLRERALAAARARSTSGWLIVLDEPTYLAVMSSAVDRNLRREVYEAWHTRASDEGPSAGRWDNTQIIIETLRVRKELAGLLGYANYAELSLATKMAQSVEEVLQFLERLAAASRPHAEREMDELVRFADRPLEAWDVAFYSERLRRHRHSISHDVIRHFFPVDHVLAGLLELAGRLWRVRFIECSPGEAYHPDVRHFDVFDMDGTARGGLLFDLFSREGKRGNAWMDPLVGRMRIGTTAPALPIASINCNFAPPAGDQPCLLRHPDVLVLFHEFGHALHHLLTKVDYPSLAGLNGVAWDAMELPSQFMENYAWCRELLPRLSHHVESGRPLPAEMLDAMLGARRFQAGMRTLRQVEYALFDMRLHGESGPWSHERLMALLAEVRAKVSVVKAPSFDRFPHHFSHIFSVGYAAGYYSYKWAEVLSADAFVAFEEEGVLDGGAPDRFREAILEVGGAEEAMDAFVHFRGRRPDPEAMLRAHGLIR